MDDIAAFFTHGNSIFIRGITNPEEMFLCGLLHDFGKLIPDSFFHDAFVLARNKKMPGLVNYKKQGQALYVLVKNYA